MAGGGGKAGANNQADTLGRLSTQLFNETDPVRTELLGQGLEGLKTGGIGSQIPLISRAIEQARSALSKTMADTSARLGTAGLARSPFGQMVLANTQQQGEAGIADIGPKMVQNFLQMIPGFVTGQTQAGISGQSAAAGAEAQQLSSENQAFATIMAAAMPNVTLKGGLPGLPAVT